MLTLFLHLQSNPITPKDGRKSFGSAETSIPQVVTLLQILITLLTSLLLTTCAAGSSGLLRPNGVAVARDGSLFVMDRGNYRVVHLSATGQLLHAFGELGAEPGDIYSGWDIALDAAGNIYICNQTRAEEGAFRSADGVKVFTAEGRFLQSIGEQTYAFEDEAWRDQLDQFARTLTGWTGNDTRILEFSADEAIAGLESDAVLGDIRDHGIRLCGPSNYLYRNRTAGR
jgi:hypothetical protein